MGAYRLLLAVLVLISHTNTPFLGYNIGVAAVISFFIISGYVMTALIDRRYSSPSSIVDFYKDRALRLYPQFLFYVAVNTAIIYFLLPNSAQSPSVEPKNIALTVAMLPLGYYMFGAADPNIAPPAWSLGLELSFYLIFPAIIYLRARGPFFIISAGIFLLAYFRFIDTDIYGYRLLPGVLFIFLCGSYLYRPSSKIKHIPFATSAASLLLFIAAAFGLIEKGHHAVEVTAGVAIGIPVVYALAKLGFHRIDEFLGNISYGVFLSHFTAIYVAFSMGIHSFDWGHISVIIASSVMLSAASYYLVERPALRYRHKIRNGASSTTKIPRAA